MSLRTEVLLWAQRVISRAGAPAHQLLEVPATATADQVQDAFHKVARTSHPDLHRTTLTADELEMVTTAYARVAGAYQELRGARMAARNPSMTPPGQFPRIAKPGEPAAAAGAAPMNGKASIYYRKAEMSLRKGEVKTALLQLKMAIAADPQSTFLRTALTEVEAELAKQP